MRIEVYRCKVCKKEHNAQYVLPIAWLTVKRTGVFAEEIESHYCSLTCLSQWLNTQTLEHRQAGQQA